MLRKGRAIYTFIGSFAIFISISCLPLLHAQERAEVQVGAERLAENLYLLRDSAGMGNTVVLTGDDGLLMVDTKDEKSVGTLLEKTAELSDKPIRFVIITHWHFDHVGGNKKIAQTGATIVAHENVRKRMGIEHDMKMLNAKVPPSPESARPPLTFKRELRFHVNGEDVKVFHLDPGHTDGDAVVYFANANVIHMGDLYFEGLYPYIGIYSGGSINGMIKVINQILPMIDEKTKVIPGHGPLSNKARLKEYVFMLTAIRDNVGRLMQQGNTMDKVVAAQPTKEFDGKWGKGFLKPDQFAGLVYMDLSPKLP
ncbi:MAG: MBL fold metallo-hydrolase [Desulfatiglans sp.]|jgi:glyoxylase-like metal-dependent hydrolase (beta-lactamase superfamily II)|nr:MBL fold metallo-hydrolase [Desulfatiglans sp.]